MSDFNFLKDFGTSVSGLVDTIGEEVGVAFEGMGRTTVDIDEEQKRELDEYFNAVDAENVGGFGLSEEQEEKYQKFAEAGWRREMAEDGTFKYSRKKTAKEISEDIAGAVPAGKPASRAPLFTQRPQSGPSVPTGSVGYRPTQNPYQVPSYLMSSAQYNEQISKMLGGLLARSIRNNPIKLLV